MSQCMTFHSDVMPFALYHLRFNICHLANHSEIDCTTQVAVLSRFSLIFIDNMVKVIKLARYYSHK